MDAKRFLAELSSKDLEAIEMALNRLHSEAVANNDEVTIEQTKAASGIISEASVAIDATEPIDEGRLSSVSDVDAWNDLCARSREDAGMRSLNSSRLQAVVDLHYPTTEKGQH